MDIDFYVLQKMGSEAVPSVLKDFTFTNPQVKKTQKDIIVHT